MTRLSTPFSFLFLLSLPLIFLLPTPLHAATPLPTSSFHSASPLSAASSALLVSLSSSSREPAAHHVTRRASKAQHVNSITYHFHAFDEHHSIELTKNTRLFGSTRLRLRNNGGVHEQHRPRILAEQCHYDGKVFVHKNGSATQRGTIAVQSCGAGLEGTLYLDSRPAMFIRPASDHLLQPASAADHILTSLADMPRPDSTWFKDIVLPDDELRRKLQTFNFSTQAVASYDYVLELFVVFDRDMFLRHRATSLETTIEALTEYATKMLSLTDQHYHNLNLGVRVQVVAIEIWYPSAPIDIVSDALTTHANFKAWSRTQHGDVPHDMAQLVTATDFNGGALGLAPQPSQSCVVDPTESVMVSVVQDFINSDAGILSGSPQNLAYTSFISTHEIGHSLGNPHLTAAQNCIDAGTTDEETFMRENAGPYWQWSECIVARLTARLPTETCLFANNLVSADATWCGVGFFDSGGDTTSADRCQPCSINCVRCISTDECTRCANDRVLSGQQCAESCEVGYYWAGGDGSVDTEATIDGYQCELCPENGISCAAGQIRTCNERTGGDTVCVSSGDITPCAAEGVWAQADPDTTLEEACPADFTGTRTRHCDINGNWQNEDLSSCEAVVVVCAATDPWPATPIGDIVTLDCATGYTGEQSRRCGSGGAWEVPNTSACVAEPTHCPADGDYPETPVSTIVTLDCSGSLVGERTRRCSSNGVWETENQNGCSEPVESCAADGAWPSTSADTTATVSCPGTALGSQTRHCSASSTWGTVDASACVAVCGALDGWPQTLIGATAALSCPTGASGTMTRACKASPFGWSDVDTSSCTPSSSSCPSDSGWALTPLGSTAALPCPAATSSGVQLRLCTLTGVWAAPNQASCSATVAECPEDGVWAAQALNTTASLACTGGLSGSRTRTCSAAGIWSDEDTTGCVDQLVPCASGSGYPQTNPGHTAVGECPSDSVGSTTRLCSHSGMWQEPSLAACGEALPACSADDIWPVTDLETWATAACPTGYSGSRQRYCSASGAWQLEDTSGCEIQSSVTCPALDDYPLTNAGTTASRECAEGEATRLCRTDGTWANENTAGCSATGGVEGNSSCAAEAGFPITQVGSVAERECDSGLTGTVTRLCTTGAVWAAEDSSGCSAISTSSSTAGGDDAAALGGGVGGTLGGLALIGFAVWFYRHRRWKAKQRRMQQTKAMQRSTSNLEPHHIQRHLSVHPIASGSSVADAESGPVAVPVSRPVSLAVDQDAYVDPPEMEEMHHPHTPPSEVHTISPSSSQEDLHEISASSVLATVTARPAEPVLPPHITRHIDPATQVPYWYNSRTQVSTWSCPI